MSSLVLQTAGFLMRKLSVPSTGIAFLPQQLQILSHVEQMGHLHLLNEGNAFANALHVTRSGRIYDQTFPIFEIALLC